MNTNTRKQPYVKPDGTTSTVFDDLYTKAYAEKQNQKSAVGKTIEKRLKEPAAKTLSTPSRYLKERLADTDENGTNTKEVLSYARPASVVFGRLMDRTLVRHHRAKSALTPQGIAAAGELFRKEYYPDEDALFLSDDSGGINPEGLTYGDIRMFLYKARHPEVSEEKLFSVRDESNAGRPDSGLLHYSSLGKGNRLRKQADLLISSVKADRFEEYLKSLVEKDPGLFSDTEKKVLSENNRLLYAGSQAQFRQNCSIIEKYLAGTGDPGLTSLDLGSFFSSRDFDRLMSRDPEQLSPILRSLKLKLRQDPVLEGAFLTALSSKRSLAYAKRKNQDAATRGTLTGFFMEKAIAGMEQEDNFSNMYSPTAKALSVSKKGVSVGAHAAKAAGTGSIAVTRTAGKLTVTVLEETGNEVGARALQSIGDSIRTGEQGLKRLDQKVRSIPSRTAHLLFTPIRYSGHMIGNSIRSSKAARSLSGNRLVTNSILFLRKTGKFSETAISFITAPLRLFAKGIDAVKRYLLKPAAVLAGALLLCQIVIAAASGTASGSGGISFLILDSDEHFHSAEDAAGDAMGFQQRYNASQESFQSRIDEKSNGYADTPNKKGQKIRYGVNGAANTGEENKNEDYVNGVTLSFDSAVSNNLEDILSVLAVLMQQDQESHHKEALELLAALYDSSHSYDYSEGPLYTCEHGCETTHYLCNQWKDHYPDSDLRFDPWLKEQLVIPTSEQECEVCRDLGKPYTEYAGCTVTGTCYHGDGGDMGGSPGTCTNYEAVYSCPGHEVEHTSSYTDADGNTVEDSWTETVYCSSEIGCEGHYECLGHDHYGCPEGHDVKCCYGHVNLFMNVHMKNFQELMELGIEPEEGSAEDTSEPDNTEVIVPDESADTLPDYAKDFNKEFTAAGEAYRDYVLDWIRKYPELAKAFLDSGGWNIENKEWAEAIRSAGDFYELYGIKGGNLDFTGGTSGGSYIDGVVVSAESLSIPDNGSSLPIVYMTQGSGAAWAGVPFGGGTIASSGCSVTSLAMVLSYLRSGVDSSEWVYPNNIVASIASKYGNYNYFYASDGSGQSWDIFGAVADMYGVSCRELSSSEILSELASGNPVIMSCIPGEFTQRGHFIVLTGFTDDGYLLVNDPNGSHASYSYRKYTLNYLISQGKGWWSFHNI